MAIAAILHVLSRIENHIISPVIIIIVPSWLVLIVIIWIVVETYELAIIVLGETVECNGADLLVGVEDGGLGWLLIIPSASKGWSLTQMVIPLVQRVDHHASGVERGRTADGTAASMAAVLAAGRVAIFFYDLNFLIIGAHINRCVW